MVYSGVCMCVKGCALVGVGEEWELGACRAAFHVQAELRDPEAELGPSGRNAIPQSSPRSLSPLLTTAVPGGPGEGAELLAFSLGRIAFQEGPARTQDFHFNAPWQAALPEKLPSPRNLLKTHGKAFKNTLITNNSSASPDFPP